MESIYAQSVLNMLVLIVQIYASVILILLEKIMNYVPVFDKSAISNFEGCTGTYITISFSFIEGTKIELTVPEDATLKDVFLEFGKKK